MELRPNPQPIKEVQLKVAEAIQDDANKGIVRMDSNYMRDIGVRPGDLVEIKGQRTTVAIVDRAYPGDIGLSIIRMDGLTRRNAKTGISEFATVKAAEFKEAKKVVIAPAKSGIIVRASPGIFKQGLLGRAVIKGDIISLGGTRRRRNTMTNSPFYDEVFSMLDESIVSFGFGDIKFVVVSTLPKQAVVITDASDVVFSPESIEMEEDFALEVTYEDIGGLHEEITKVREMVELPLKHPELFERLGVEPPKGVLLHGPPGTGKTLLAKAVASETNSHFICINGPEIMSKFYGQSEENLRKKFEEAEKNAPSIIFIDEIDAIASKREETRGEVERRVVAQLLALMDGLKSRGKVVVIAATNVPSILDPALRRPGRFDREIEIGVPSVEGRLNILKIHTRNMPYAARFHAEDICKQINKNIEDRLKDIDVAASRIKDLMSSLRQRISSKAKPSEVGEVSDEQGIDDFEKEYKRLVERRQKIESSKEMLSDKDGLIRVGSILSNLENSFNEIREKIMRTNPKEKEPVENILLNQIKAKEPDLFKVLTLLSSPDLFGIEILNPESEFYNECRYNKDRINEEYHQIARITHGFVGADLASLAKEAAMIVLRRELQGLKLSLSSEEAIPESFLKRLKIEQKDFKDALKTVRPSAMREVLVEVPNIRWETIGGLKDVKEQLKESVEWPLKSPEAFKRLGVTPPKGILLYGPPGTGKTLLAKAVATESEANFILVNGPSLLSKWVGESEKAVRKVFEKARQTAPTIIFFDEIDALAPRRGHSTDSHVTERVVNQLLSEIDGIEPLHDVVILAATNRPDILDTALMRPGRFDRIIMVGVPDKEPRRDIFAVHTANMPMKDVDINDLADRTEGYVGADIEAVCREAAIGALRKDIKAKIVTKADFDDALLRVKASVTPQIIKMYKDLEDSFKQARAKEMAEERPSYFG